MKKNLSFFAPLVLWICLSLHGSGQTGLKVDSLLNFPALPDTALQGVVYDSIQVRVHNFSSNPFSGSVEVYMMTDTLQQVEILRSDSNTILTIAPGTDTILHTLPSFFFNPSSFAAGDNIVVVWPHLRTAFPIDSFYIHVHYTLATGLDDPLADHSIVLSPVPAWQVLGFKYTKPESIEQVRIFNAMGRLMLDSPVPIQTLDVTSYPAGIYYVSILRKNGTRVVKKILKIGY
jgi:hypothetical protein